MQIATQFYDKILEREVQIKQIRQRKTTYSWKENMLTCVMCIQKENGQGIIHPPKMMSSLTDQLCDVSM